MSWPYDVSHPTQTPTCARADREELLTMPCAAQCSKLRTQGAGLDENLPVINRRGEGSTQMSVSKTSALWTVPSTSPCSAPRLVANVARVG